MKLPNNELVVVYDDVTSERQHEEALRRANADLEWRVIQRTNELTKAKQLAEAASYAKTEFLAKMSHELRTPLNAIIGYSDAILHGVLGPVLNDRLGEYVGDIKKSGEHLLELINDILDVSAIEIGRVELIEEEMDPVEIADCALNLIRPRAERDNISLETNFAAGLPRFRGDSRRIKRILVNLLTNGVKFTREGGNVALAIDTMDSGAVRFVIADTGIGMDEAGIAVAFMEFGQVRNGLGSQEEGTGLGLPLCRQFAEAHGGTLTVRSRLGVGTKVVVEFPPERSIWSGRRRSAAG